MNMSKTKKENIKYFFFFFIGIFVSYILFLNPLLTSDYIPSFWKPSAPPSISGALSAGRYVNYFLVWMHYLLHFVHITYFENAWVMQIMGMAVYALCCVKLENMVISAEESGLKRFFIDAAILLMFVNPFMVETYIYGCIDWAIGIYLAVLGVDFIIKERYIVAGIFLFLSLTTYQTNIIIAFVLAVGIIFIKYAFQDTKKAFIKSALLSLEVAGTVLLSYALQWIVASTGWNLNDAKTMKASADGFLPLCIQIVKVMKSIYITMYNMLPAYFFPIVIIFGFGLGIIGIILRKEKWYIAVYYAVLTMALFIAPFLYAIAQDIAWYTQRSLLSILFAFGIFLICTFCIVKKCKWANIGLAAISVIFMGINVYYTETCILDSYIGQAVDRNEILCIMDEIAEYESASGKEIQTLAIWNPPQKVYTYEVQQINYDYGTTYGHRMLYDNWAQGHLLNYVGQTTYDMRRMTEEEFKNYFSGEIGNRYNPSKQIYFEEDTMYWIIY